jgi:FAD/FMN-containing dehydrogenase
MVPVKVERYHELAFLLSAHPQAIARVRDTADVIACVRFARARAIPISVRGGGHNAAGLGVGDGALVIDLSMLRGTTVSPDRRTVRADAGCTWGDVDHATVAFGMATPSGFLSSTGVAGLTLGGGIGYLSRRFGLTADNLLAAEVVLADGTFVTVSQDSHPDLFWAPRGGAETSASSPRSPSGATPSASTAPSSAARSSTTWLTPPR